MSHLQSEPVFGAFEEWGLRGGSGSVCGGLSRMWDTEYQLRHAVFSRHDNLHLRLALNASQQ